MKCLTVEYFLCNISLWSIVVMKCLTVESFSSEIFLTPKYLL